MRNLPAIDNFLLYVYSVEKEKAAAGWCKVTLKQN